jgi:hypothetical protein
VLFQRHGRGRRLSPPRHRHHQKLRARAPPPTPH